MRATAGEPAGPGRAGNRTGRVQAAQGISSNGSVVVRPGPLPAMRGEGEQGLPHEKSHNSANCCGRVPSPRVRGEGPNPNGPISISDFDQGNRPEASN